MFHSTSWRFKDQQDVYLLIHLLNEMMKEIPEAQSRRDFVKQFRDFSINKSKQFPATTGELFYQNMTDYDWYKMLDYLQVYQAHDSVRKKEKVMLDASQAEASARIFSAFVAMAKRVTDKDKPLILVMTSSARDPFDAVDFYLQVFKQAGADSQWLPLEQALSQAIESSACDKIEYYREQFTGSVRRAEVFPDLAAKQAEYCESPELLTQLIKQADGIFINGGDQSLTRATLIPGQDSEFMQLIRSQVEGGQLVIGGTSAGAAVQSGRLLNNVRVPMISSGQSYAALVHGAFNQPPPAEGCEKTNSCGKLPKGALTYHPEGGLGLINTGLIDTHFSERGRQVRLMQLAAETNTPIAIGVDETTAVKIAEDNTSIRYEVVGENGAWFFENSSLKTNDAGDKILSSTAHYLNEHDVLIFLKSTTETRIIFDKPGTPVLELGIVPIPDDILYRDAMNNVTARLAKSNQENLLIKTRASSPQYLIQLNKSKEFMSKLSNTQSDNSDSKVSFRGLSIIVEQLL
jgi:cyanophycinase